MLLERWGGFVTMVMLQMSSLTFLKARALCNSEAVLLSIRTPAYHLNLRSTARPARASTRALPHLGDWQNHHRGRRQVNQGLGRRRVVSAAYGRRARLRRRQAFLYYSWRPACPSLGGQSFPMSSLGSSTQSSSEALPKAHLRGHQRLLLTVRMTRVWM